MAAKPNLFRNTGRTGGAESPLKRRYFAARHTPFYTLILLCIGLGLGAQEISLEQQMDWMDGSVIIDLSAPLPEGSMNPTHRYQTEQYLSSRASELITNSLGSITVDSRNTLGDLLYSDPLFYTRVEEQISLLSEEFGRSSQDMRSFHLRYRVPFYPLLVSFFSDYEQPDRRTAFFEPLDHRRESFTGIVILAQGDLPLHSQDQRGHLTPALFPKIRDTELQIIYRASMVDPQYLQRWGMVQYSRELNPQSVVWQERAGNKPLHLSARAVFGTQQCDIILDDMDCRLILANEENNRLLEEGRVLILLSPESTD